MKYLNNILFSFLFSCTFNDAPVEPNQEATTKENNSQQNLFPSINTILSQETPSSSSLALSLSVTPSSKTNLSSSNPLSSVLSSTSISSSNASSSSILAQRDTLLFGNWTSSNRTLEFSSTGILTTVSGFSTLKQSWRTSSDTLYTKPSTCDTCNEQVSPYTALQNLLTISFFGKEEEFTKQPVSSFL